ncbi:uncharacterized protein TNCV_1975861 [Trichonephila clavipes]|nr:uncharacterized protein TNCV_1975861 [Trichonephila clavipes]
MFGTLPYDSPLPNQEKLNYPPIQQARQIAVNRTIKHHKINKQSPLGLADLIMNDIEMDPPSPAPSYKAYEELLMSRPSTPLTPEPTTACGRRRAAMTRLKNQETMIEGYQRFLATFNKGKDEHGVYKQLQESLNETIEARDSLVSELRTMPPCLNQSCPDHTELKAKLPHVDIPKKPLRKRDKMSRITRMTLSSQIKLLARPPQRQNLRQSQLTTLCKSRARP